MGQHFIVAKIKGFHDFTTAENGEKIIFGAKLEFQDPDEIQDIHFTLDHELLSPLIAQFQAVGMNAENLRKKNPIHGGIQSGFIFEMVKASIAVSTKEGGPILHFEVRGSKGGRSKYALSTDRAGLENLVSLIRQYLDDPNSENRLRPTPH